MKIDIQIISEEYITPSSPTPPHLRRHHLSFLDKLQPSIYLPWIMFYPKDDQNTVHPEQQCDKLKKSLSEALTLFYPLAGRIKVKDAYVDCNDQGAYFVQAKSNCRLSDILGRRDPNDLTNFIPFELYAPCDEEESPTAVVQVTHFECGGVAVFSAISHGTGDASSLFMFLNCWAAIARGDVKNIIAPRFESATFFPPATKDTSWYDPKITEVYRDVVTKRFVFNASSVATLVEKYTKNVDERRPTRFEALSAFVWSRLIGVSPHKRKLYSASHAVNLRPRMDPTLSNNHFGNIVFMVCTAPAAYLQEDKNFVDRVRENVSRVNAEFVRELQGSDSENLEFYKDIIARDEAGEVGVFLFTSLTSFPTHGADFGWGKPAWAAALPMPIKNMVTFFNEESGDGIEAWLNLKEEDMAVFETDGELLSYVTV